MRPWYAVPLRNMQEIEHPQRVALRDSLGLTRIQYLHLHSPGVQWQLNLLGKATGADKASGICVIFPRAGFMEHSPSRIPASPPLSPLPLLPVLHSPMVQDCFLSIVRRYREQCNNSMVLYHILDVRRHLLLAQHDVIIHPSPLCFLIPSVFRFRALCTAHQLGADPHSRSRAFPPHPRALVPLPSPWPHFKPAATAIAAGIPEPGLEGNH